MNPPSTSRRGLQPAALKYSIAACAFSALVLLGTWATMVSMLHWQWKETLNAEMRQNTNTAIALKEHTLRILDTVAQAMALVQRAAADHALGGDALVRIANDTGMTPNILTQLSFIDADGIFQGSNLDPDGSKSKNVNLMEREHVRVHLQPESTTAKPMRNGLFISKPLVGKVSGVRTIQLTRKIVAADGSTLGVVVASLNQSHFINVYRDVDLGARGGVALAELDGALRVRVIGGANAEIVHPLPEPMIKATRLRANGALKVMSSDGIERIVGFSRVGDYDLTVQTGTSTEDAFASWREMRNTVLLLTSLLSVAVMVFVAAFLASIRRLARSNEALQHSEAQAQSASRAKSEFLAAMSHELRTPLTSIRGFAELMELRSKDPMVREQSALIRQGSEHLNALLTEILDLAKVEAGSMPIHPEPVALPQLLPEVAELFRISAVAKGLALETLQHPAAAQPLLTDRLKLKQILNNLLSNAIKFTAEGGVELAVEPSADGRWMLFHVTDTGPGIAPELQEVIFEKFSQGNARVSYQHGGTGLGLSLSRALATLLGGTLTVQSSPGEGARFTLALPTRPATAA
ncbi:sensor histidine kinase [Alicycliphilus sp. T452]